MRVIAATKGMFSQVHPKIQHLTLSPAPSTEQEHIIRVCDYPTTLESITPYALEDGLHKRFIDFLVLPTM